MQWPDVRLQTAVHAKHIRGGKSRYEKRNLRLTTRAAEMLMARKATTKSVWVFPGETNESAILGTSLDHQHEDVRRALKLPKDFVIHSLRHTMLTRLGEAVADTLTIMKIAGHSSVTVSQRYVHPTPEGMDRAFDRLERLNEKFEQAELEGKAEASGGSQVPTISPTVRKRRVAKSLQIIEIKSMGP